MILQGFGTRMAPFFRPGEELQVEPLENGGARPGDVLVFRTQDRSYSIEPSNFSGWVTHRLIRRLQIGDQAAYLTKGDNRLLFDPVVFPEQVVGRVVRAGRRSLAKGPWRWLGRILAKISHLQAICFHRLLCLRHSRLNQLRLRWIHQGWFPRIPLRRGYEKAVNFFSRGPIPVLGERLIAWKMKAVAAVRGIRIKPYALADLEEMTVVWNQSFPDYPTTPERLKGRIFSSSEFDPSQCLVIRRRGRLLGWGWRSDRRIEGMILTPEGWESGAVKVLFHRLCSFHSSEFPASAEYGWMPLAETEEGPLLSPEAELAAEYGFQPVHLLTEMRLTKERFRESQEDYSSSGLSLRFWEEADAERFREEFQAPEYDERWVKRHFEMGGRPDRILLAVREGRRVGISFWLPDEEVSSIAQVGEWIWSVAQPPVRRGYGFYVVVDERARGQGIGSAMIRAGSELLFQQGCSEVMVWTRAEKVFERAGYLPQKKFLRMRRNLSS